MNSWAYGRKLIIQISKGSNSTSLGSFRNEAGSNAFVLSPQKWIQTTLAIGIISKSGRYGGGTYAHKDIAFEFAAWISSEFRFYLIKEFQRLKLEENQRITTGWDVKRIRRSFMQMRQMC